MDVDNGDDARSNISSSSTNESTNNLANNNSDPNKNKRKYRTEEDLVLEEMKKELLKQPKIKAPPGREDDEVDQFHSKGLPAGFESYDEIHRYYDTRYCEHESFSDWMDRANYKRSTMDHQLIKGTILEQVMEYLLQSRFHGAVVIAHFGKG